MEEGTRREDDEGGRISKEEGERRVEEEASFNGNAEELKSEFFLFRPIWGKEG